MDGTGKVKIQMGMMNKIVFKYKNEYFLFASFKRGSSDGSFYWQFERKGKIQNQFLHSTDSCLYDIKQIQKEKAKKIEISYHPTGCIHYKTIENNPKIYAESLFGINQYFTFGLYSVPKISRLDKYSRNKINKDTVIIEFFEAECYEQRITFSITISPCVRADNALLKIEYQDERFSVLLNIENSSLISTNYVQDAFVFMRPNGLFEKQQTISDSDIKKFFNQDEEYDKQWALIKYHQKINDTKELIVYEHNENHEYRMVFSVPMRIPPKINIIFDNPKYNIYSKEHKCTYCLFNVVDEEGNIVKDSELVNIKHISLDAEL